MDEELKEEDFIQDEFKQSPNPYLLAIFFLAIITILITAIHTWYAEHQSAYRKTSPFYQVTNRDFSLFLLQNPRFLNQNVSNKEAYLPGLQYLKKLQSNLKDADNLVDAPDQMIFYYQTWNRLIDYPPPPRTIPVGEYKDFLSQYEEWTPVYWRNATRDYEELYRQIQNGTAPQNLATVSKLALPDDAREAFIGWKNAIMEKEELEKFRPTFALLKEFLDKYPNFQRNYWFNILKASDWSYLETISFDKYDPTGNVPEDQIAPFLQIALFNYKKALDEAKPSS